MISAKADITLVGSGLAGPLLAIELKKRGHGVKLYERRPDMRKVKISAGRSINLALSTRGIHALRAAGVWGEMQPIIIPMRGRMMHSTAGELTFMPYGKDETEVIHSISRAELNIALMNAAETRGVSIEFNQRCTGYDARTGEVRLRDEESGDERVVEPGVTIGTDGAVSAIRLAMQVTLPRFNLSQQYLDYGYKELTIPAGADSRHQLEKNALHIWPRGNLMLIALPNIDGTFGCILFLPFEGKGSFAELDSDAKVRAFFEAQFPDALRLMPGLLENYNANPVGAMVTIRCSPWHMEGRALLLGDAAHAIVPFFGQGLNAAFEDITVLLEMLDRRGRDARATAGGDAGATRWRQLFEEFEVARKQNTDAIADLALENFVEMRDKVADPRFLFRKKVELALEARYPGHFVPKYAMVTFHRLPYAVALSRGRVQDRMLGELCAGIERVEELDWERAEALIQRELAPLGELQNA
ncbi:MAG: FAD-dependent monooxygenase [Candidatus Koribacter versatilis]|uniref:Kynurenine 3-monooxygenase n=1 Tax=Candidatus Korobacter versatilis TaxID=658062 RepID=A0A932A913_9BACT|nr:FAD-dependent monooxygenase [Candidatus Koribacter versatilis]